MLGVDVDLDIGTLRLRAKIPAEAGHTLIIGPNGAGKSTLLKIILGVQAPDRGMVRVGGRCLVDTSRGYSLSPEKRKIGYVPQKYALFPHKSVRQNVEFGIRHLPSLERRAKAEELLKELEVAHLIDRDVRTLSGGESQRVALARALAIDPDMLLLDEPMAALDAAARRVVRVFLADRLEKLGIPTVIVTHDSDDLAALPGRVVVLESGHIAQIGSLERLTSFPSSPFVAEFLGTAYRPQPETPTGSVR